MIAKNESARIAACMESIRPHVDEIVLVDTGSTDDTAAIAAKYADIVCPSALFNSKTLIDDFHFAEARNEALALCSGDWVLSIDADETITANGHRETLEREPGNAAFVAMYGHDGGYFWVPRLFRREGHTWHGRYHDVPTPFDDPSRMPPDILSIVNHAPPQEPEKQIRNIALLRRQMQDEKTIGYTTLRLADTYLSMGTMYVCNALGHYQAYIAQADRTPWLTYAQYQVGLCYAAIGLHGAAIEQLFSVIRQHPNHAYAWFALGGSYYRLGRKTLARETWRQILNIPEADEMPRHPCAVQPIDRQKIIEWIDALERNPDC